MFPIFYTCSESFVLRDFALFLVFWEGGGGGVPGFGGMLRVFLAAVPGFWGVP